MKIRSDTLRINTAYLYNKFEVDLIGTINEINTEISKVEKLNRS